MNSMMLGASLYVPATHDDMITIGNGQKYPQLRSVIFCTEDAVAERDLKKALTNLEDCLDKLLQTNIPKRFIRVRNEAVMKSILDMKGIEKIDGFVLPKVTNKNVLDYFNLIKGKDFTAMITLETKECFDDMEMIKLRNTLLKYAYNRQTLSLRIGGNDLLNAINMRRVRGKTIYDTPIGQTISRLVSIFKPFGFQLSAPVCEYINDLNILKKEIELDLAHGLIGKTAIHPSQIELIENHYKVCPRQLEEANYILSNEAKAVYKMNDAMLEVATHSSWAKSILIQAEIFGVAA